MFVTMGCAWLTVFLVLCIRDVRAQPLDKPRGPWELAFKVVSGKWDSGVIGESSFWDLFTSTRTYSSATPIQDTRDFTTTSDHYKSSIVEDWGNKYISVQAIKLAFFKNNQEAAYVVFDSVGKTKTTWFKCDNILYSSYTDLPDTSLGNSCPGQTATGFPLTIMKLSFLQAPCTMTTGWILVADTDLQFSICTNYAPYDGPEPYFKYSTGSTLADMSTGLESADSIAIFFQVWDIAFKGISGVQPTASSLTNLTGLFLSDLTENDNSDVTIRNLHHVTNLQLSGMAPTYKSGVIDLWESYFLDMAKFSMLENSVEVAYVTFNAIDTTSLSWFSEENILYSSFGDELVNANLDVCSIEGDSFRHWQIQSVANEAGCADSDQLGWMLVKEPKHNGTCPWDGGNKKPYFMYNPGDAPTNPSNFQYADVMTVFVHGWRMVFKISSGIQETSVSSVFSLWSQPGSLNEDLTSAFDVTSGSPYLKSTIIDQWDTTYVHAVKLAAFKDEQEVFHVVFDATGSGSNLDWMSCDKILYTSVLGLDKDSAVQNSYSCRFDGSPFSLLIGKSPDCGTASFTGVFAILDRDDGCSSRSDLPIILFSDVFDDVISESSTSQEADTFAIFFDMENCYDGLCENGGTCQDLGGNFRCFCSGLYYGHVCDDLDGSFTDWVEWSACSVTCGDGTRSRTRVCQGTEGVGICAGSSEETDICSLSPCPIDGGFAEWATWSDCTLSCGSGTQSRARTCTNPEPQHGGNSCSGDTSETIDCNTQNCPIDGGLSGWGEWSPCTKTCGTGEEQRSRSCTNPAPQYGGADCVGSLTDTQPCSTQECPVHGGFAEWATWSDCTLSCGSGTQSRARTCTNPEPQHGGNPCSGDTSETINCNTQNCPIDGGLFDWGEWSSCTKTCGTGEEQRSRSCTNPAPQYGGADCVGPLTDTQPCSTHECPVDGGFEEWTTWSDCTLSCGSGTQSRARNCTNPEPQHGGSPCSGDASETIDCNTQNCPIDGGLSGWGEWSPCTKTCGTGEEQRSRSCTNPAPQYGGADCVGSLTDTQPCNPQECPIDGGFSTWSIWTSCTSSCGTGSQSRTRSCTNPEPQHGGIDCVGETTESQPCNTHHCPIHGGFTDWSTWSTCTDSCDTGTQTRTRSCTNPIPEHGGDDCTGDLTESQSCNTDPCPVHGSFTQWTTWGTCTDSCDTGTQIRTRSCTNPIPQHGGDDCTGDLTESQGCNTDPCPVHGGLTEWTTWSTCTESCDTGTQTRTRSCSNPLPQHGGNDCTGDLTDSQSCNTNLCPIHGGLTEWNIWGTCTESCDTGTQTRTRSCSNPIPQYGGNDCPGDLTESKSCNTDPCPIHGGLTEWTIWSTCTESCDTGTQTRTRSCTNPISQHGGDDCTGDLTESQSCNTDPCPVDGGLTEWTIWSTCTESCGTGTQTRTRSCTNPIPQHGGDDCTEDLTENQSCNTDLCPIHGDLTEWTTWSTCTESCDTGTQTRTRSCTNPLPQHGGDDCTEDLTESQSCNTGPCPIHGGLTEWSTWSTCTESCDTGTQSRTRSCNNPTPEHGGDDCTGDLTESQNCNSGPCPVHGGLREWTTWSTCTESCGSGIQTRTRSCTNPLPQHGGDDCTEELIESQSCNIDPCPIHGGLTEWSTWGTCTDSCGTGTQTRTRSCTNPTPENGGDDCTGDLTESQNCNSGPCPVHGGLTEWTTWSTCTESCGTGTQTRTRSCTNPIPQHGGDDCTEELIESQSCNTDPCPIHGGLTEWTTWGTCTESCGTGTQTRTRSCTNPIPQHGGDDCTGDLTESQSCNTDPCPSTKVHGGLTEWTTWSTCTESCSTGTQTRTRSCTNPIPEHGGNDCTGDLTDSQSCNTGPCPVHGGLTEWTTWGTCTESCGTGTQTRTRSCTNPIPENGGDDCTGDLTESQSCNTNTCPFAVHGGLTEWSTWSTCTESCDTGTETRTRSCTNPIPQHGGDDCTGDLTESQSCNIEPCPSTKVHGGLTEWSTWGTCTESCGTGTRTRTRSCSNPTPQNGGDDCTGELTESQNCNTDPCPSTKVHGGLTEWATWSTCTESCDTGTQTRTRSCTNPIPQNGGDDCAGDLTESQSCNNNPCPIHGGLTEWSTWSTCTESCGTGTQTRTRSCTNPIPEHGGDDCTGDLTESLSCNSDPCPVHGGLTEWSTWSTCTESCDTGTQTRTRSCTNPIPQHGGDDCTGDLTESLSCNSDQCPVHGGLTEWTSWGTCTESCGTGTQTRTRSCTNPIPQHGGDDCTDSQSCNTDPCPIHGGLTQWSTWDTCTESCGTGTQTRTRSCTNPIPEHGGDDCTGDLTDSQSCNTASCPSTKVHGGLTEWTTWSTCTKSCDTGTQTRTRSCTNPIPQNGGDDCAGDLTESQICNTYPCPIHGGLTEWSTWSTCTESCDTGTQTRTRSCTNPIPEHGGDGCTGDLTDSQSCNIDPCPVHGGLTQWSTWGTCTESCGSGTQTRTRSCTNPIPEHGGDDCTGDLTESQSCNIEPCPIHGGLTEWSTWSTCTESCDTGTQTRTRSCTNPIPQHGGDDCTGDLTESQSCNTEPCPIHGGLTEWTTWRTCTESCDTGTQSRTRSCTNPIPQHGGDGCAGDLTESQSCNTDPCSVDGGFSLWSPWSDCSLSCDSGSQTRTRTCTNPEPLHGGTGCVGSSSESQICFIQACPVDGGFTDWGTWGDCTKTCGTGSQVRTRTCSNPEPNFGGSSCIGSLSDSQECNQDPCPVDGEYTEWSEWLECTVSCGTGSRTRSRSCTNPLPEHGGLGCTGPETDTDTCNTHLCPIDGGLTTWSNWGDCSVTCGTGIQERTRSCTNPSPQHGGLECTGVTDESKDCNTQLCPIDGGLSTWSNWGDCTVTCGTGIQERTRSCTNPSPQHGGLECTGVTDETRDCNTQLCPLDGGLTTWSNWGECTVTCGTGIQERTRSCTNPSPQYGGLECSGITDESNDCNTELCPIDGGLTTWSYWGDCTVTCGTGIQERTRSCTNPSPQHGGLECTGVTDETRDCNTQLCPIDGGLTTWSNWGECTATCGTGIQERTRSCTNPSPQHGGLECTGVMIDTDTCNTQLCPIDGGLTTWSNWGACTVTCGTGIQERTRSCTNPSPQYGGLECSGVTYESNDCNTDPCPVPGGFGDWSEWSACSHSCGGGSQSRSRDCTNPTPMYGGSDCDGATDETLACNELPCPVDGGLSDWSEWSACSQTCDVGSQIRFRTCSNPVPQYGGGDCVGTLVEFQSCQLTECPVNGDWTTWSPWGECSKSCETGVQHRSRSCTNPPPEFGGLHCEGPSSDTQECNINSCPISGGFTEWNVWSDCSKTCDTGYQVRLRECSNPVPQYGGGDCVGSTYESRDCIDIHCPVDGYFTSWSLWSDCTVTCEGGTKTRTRSCIGPYHGGTNCVGETTNQADCNIQACPVDGYWLDWSEWTVCTATCNGGITVRVRQCVEPVNAGNQCQGLSQELSVCEEGPCPKIDGSWSNWSAWTSCSQTCGTGYQTRSRTCTEPAPQWGGADCLGNHTESDNCVLSHCPVDGIWTAWQSWSSCYNMTNTECESNCECGNGVTKRERTCTNPAPENGGTPCDGESSEMESCLVPCLKVQCDADHPQHCQVVAVPKTGRYSGTDSIAGNIEYLYILMSMCFFINRV